MKNFGQYDKRGVADRLRELRHKRGLGMKEVSELAGVSFSQLSKLESAGGKMGIFSLVRLADFYKVPKEWVLMGEGGDQIIQNATHHSTQVIGSNGVVVVNGDGKPHSVREMCSIMMKPDTIKKAGVIAKTLGVSDEEAMEIVVKKMLEHK